MTMNLKKVFTSTSFNLSSVFYARFCAGSFYQSSTNVELSYYIKKEQKSKMISAHKNHVDPTYRPN